MIDLLGKDLVIKDQEEMSELTTEDYYETIEQNVKIKSNEDGDDIIKISVKRQSAVTKDILASISQKTDAMSDENNLKIQIR